MHPRLESITNSRNHGDLCGVVVEARQIRDRDGVADDERCLAHLKDYRSLMPMAQEARKAMFMLKPADGAIGAHQAGVTECYNDFKKLAKRIIAACDIPAPDMY